MDNKICEFRVDGQNNIHYAQFEKCMYVDIKEFFLKNMCNIVTNGVEEDWSEDNVFKEYLDLNLVFDLANHIRDYQNLAGFSEDLQLSSPFQVALFHDDDQYYLRIFMSGDHSFDLRMYKIVMGCFIGKMLTQKEQESLRFDVYLLMMHSINEESEIVN